MEVSARTKRSVNITIKTYLFTVCAVIKVKDVSKKIFTKLTLILGLGGNAGLGDLSVPLTSGVDKGVLALCGGDNKRLCVVFCPLKVLPELDSPDAVFLTI